MTFDATESLAVFQRAMQDPAGKLRLQFALASSYETFADAAEAAVEWALHLIELNPQIYEEAKEDLITESIINPLIAMNIDALHDAMMGGHGDLVIRGPNNYVWIAECKFAENLTKIFGGYGQLLNRYSTGQPSCSRGSLILYVRQPDALSRMNEWFIRLISEDDEAETDFSQCLVSPLAFVGKRKHPRTGLLYTIRHVPLCLHYAATAKSGGQSPVLA